MLRLCCARARPARRRCCWVLRLCPLDVRCPCCHGVMRRLVPRPATRWRWKLRVFLGADAEPEAREAGGGGRVREGPAAAAGADGAWRDAGSVVGALPVVLERGHRGDGQGGDAGGGRGGGAGASAGDAGAGGLRRSVRRLRRPRGCKEPRRGAAQLLWREPAADTARAAQMGPLGGVSACAAQGRPARRPK
eukprot:2553507-Rhodomonas_salina.1